LGLQILVKSNYDLKASKNSLTPIPNAIPAYNTAPFNNNAAPTPPARAARNHAEFTIDFTLSIILVLGGYTICFDSTS